MALNLANIKGCPLERQRFTWRELVQHPISKLDDDTFTRVRIILLNGLEHEALRFSHAFSRMNLDMRVPLARVRRIEQHQHTMINWLIGADHSPLEAMAGRCFAVCSPGSSPELTMRTFLPAPALSPAG